MTNDRETTIPGASELLEKLHLSKEWNPFSLTRIKVVVPREMVEADPAVGNRVKGILGHFNSSGPDCSVTSSPAEPEGLVFYVVHPSDIQNGNRCCA